MRTERKRQLIEKLLLHKSRPKYQFVGNQVQIDENQTFIKIHYLFIKTRFLLSTFAGGITLILFFYFYATRVVYFHVQRGV